MASTSTSTGTNTSTHGRGHVLLLAYPAQGHINPILQFAKRLASKGLKTTLATTVYLYNNNMHLASKHCNVAIETFSDGFDQTGLAGAETPLVYLRVFKQVGSQTLANIITKYHHTQYPITCLVSDSIIPWALDVGKDFGLVTASFFTQTCTVSSIFYHIKQANLCVPLVLTTDQPHHHLPGLPVQLQLQDFPSCAVVLEPISLHILLGQFSNVDKADWLLFNTFDQLESQVLQWMGDIWRVRTIGPTTPSMYLDKRVEGDTENSLNIFKPSDVSYIIKWLNTRETGSVLYISFGSIAELGEEQMEEVIWGVKQSGKDFIWVVREKEESKLPANYKFAAGDNIINNSDNKQGLIVAWCSQLEVLSHEAIGCFLTHCGWNSTMEALSLGVPMVAMPQIWDQFTNAKLVEDVWEVGLRVKKDENRQGIVVRKELELCIREVMEGKKGRKLKKNASRWRELAKDAVSVGGSSDLNIEEFVATVTYSTPP